MPVLIFTMIFCFIFVLMTYARLDNFLNFTATRTQFKQYIQKIEHEYTNLKASKKYESTTVSSIIGSSKAANDEDEKAAKERAAKTSSKLSIHAFLTSTERGKEPARYLQTKAVLGRLIKQLYSSYPFYKRFAKKDPEFVQEFLHRIETASDQMQAAEKQKQDEPKDADPSPIKNLNDLILLDLGSEEYNALLYKVLKGAQDPNADQKTRANISRNTEGSTSSRGEEIDDSAAIDDNGYDSILDYVTLDPSKTNVFLASRNLLMALYGRKETVDEIIQQRRKYAAELKRDRPEAEKNDRMNQMSEEFKHLYQSRLQSNVDDNLVEFKVTKSDPTKYE